MKTRSVSIAAANLLARIIMAELPAVTITTAPESVQTALISYVSDYDHHTLGINITVGGIISNLYAQSAANPTAVNAILDVRSHLNFMEGPTPLFKDLEAPSSVIASISSKLPTTAPFPEALELVSSIYGFLGSVASSQLNGETTITAPAGWTLPPLDTAAIPDATGGAAAATSTPATMATATASECPAKRMATSTITSAVPSDSAAAATMTPQAQAANGAGHSNVPQSLGLLAGILSLGLWQLV